MQPFNTPSSAAKVAEKILEGVIAEQQNNLTGAIAFFKEAVNKEDALIYNEPRDWLLPSREYLGDALMKSNNAANAEIIFKAYLKENPNNHWALYGLYKALTALKKNTEAGKVKKQFDKAFDGADILPGNIVF
jgi:tetratricopeptide (TPR) repeat protein